MSFALSPGKEREGGQGGNVSAAPSFAIRTLTTGLSWSEHVEKHSQSYFIAYPGVSACTPGGAL